MWSNACQLIIKCVIISINITIVISAIAPPPWSDPNKNPCASQPGGWQLLYWPPLNQCFKIFTIGYPCPDTMELSPVGYSATNTHTTAVCICPPGTAQSPLTGMCHKLFEKGPCEIGQYFAPVKDYVKSAIPRQKWGVCRVPNTCPNNMIYWPQDGKCYNLHTRGPCAKGKLLTIDNDHIAICKCEDSGDLSKYFHPGTKLCYEHFTKGPCERIGELFLPSRKCGCHSSLPQYDNVTSLCYELGSIGPCPPGHVFTIADNSKSILKGECQCKENHVQWKDGICYRLYTKGPCEDEQFLVNSTACLKNPCERGRLYFPDERTCYRIGSQGPCYGNQVVIFDFTVRPSLNGVSYNGVCGCTGILVNLDQKCDENYPPKSACDGTPGMVEMNGECYKLYNRGPCGPNQWLVPKKEPLTPRTAKCECRPGYTPYSENETEFGINGCHAPSVNIARYLNSRHQRSYKFGFRRISTLHVPE